MISKIKKQVNDEVVKQYFVPSKDGVKLHLLRFHPVRKKKSRYPVLLIHGFGQNRFSWIPPGSNFAPMLQDNGIDT